MPATPRQSPAKGKTTAKGKADADRIAELEKELGLAQQEAAPAPRPTAAKIAELEERLAALATAAEAHPGLPKRPAPLARPAKSNGKPKAGRRVNLNDRLASARAARAEAQGEAPVLEVGDPAKEFVLPVEMPYTFLHHCQQGQFIDAARDLGGDPLAKAVMALDLSVDDLETFFEAIAEDLYGVTEGK